MPEIGCWAADFSREAGKNACRGRPPGRPGGTVYETGSLGRICTEARRGFAQFPSGEDFAGRRGRRPLRGDEGLCVGAALAAARAGKTWTKENRGRIRSQGMVRIRPRSFVEGRLRRAGRRGRRPLRWNGGVVRGTTGCAEREAKILRLRFASLRMTGGEAQRADGSCNSKYRLPNSKPQPSASKLRIPNAVFRIPNSEFRIAFTCFPGSGSCRSPPRREGSRGRCSH